MPTDKMDPKELWVGWTRDAARMYSPPDDLEDQEELVDDMVTVTTDYASAMLDAFEEVFGPFEHADGRSAEPRAKRSKKPRRRQGDASGD